MHTGSLCKQGGRPARRSSPSRCWYGGLARACFWQASPTRHSAVMASAKSPSTPLFVSSTRFLFHQQDFPASCRSRTHTYLQPAFHFFDLLFSSSLSFVQLLWCIFNQCRFSILTRISLPSRVCSSCRLHVACIVTARPVCPVQPLPHQPPSNNKLPVQQPGAC